MKDNELEEQTALREIKEETGLDVVLDTGFRFVNTYSPTENVIKDVVYFLGFTEERVPVKKDEQVNEAGWFTFNEALSKITYDNERKLLIAAREYIEIHVL